MFSFSGYTIQHTSILQCLPQQTDSGAQRTAVQVVMTCAPLTGLLPHSCAPYTRTA